MRHILVPPIALLPSKRGAPLSFVRLVPSAEGSPSRLGTQVEVFVHPTLRVLVRKRDNKQLLLTGQALATGVTWEQAASDRVPRTAMDMIAADIADMLVVFERRLLDPRAWTADPAALAALG